MSRKEIKFTGNQLEVLQGLASGRSTAQIAKDLNLSETTVRQRLFHLRHKLNFVTNTQMMYELGKQSKNVKRPKRLDTRKAG